MPRQENCEGTMRNETYFQIMQINAVTSGKSLRGHNFVFMHGNDPKYSK